jgi:hypothetical protein
VYFFSTSLKLHAASLILLTRIFLFSEGYAQKPSIPVVKSKKMISKPGTSSQKTSKAPLQGSEAEASATVQQVITDPNSSALEPQPKVDFSSGAIRSRRPFGAQLSYTLLSDYVLQFGGALYYNLGSYWQLGASALYGSKDLSDKVGASGETKISKLTLTGSVIDVFVRWHPMHGTFSVKTGLGYRRATANYRIESAATFIEGSLNITSIVVPIFFGNHWSFDNGVQFGCDWIGAYVPLTGVARASASSNDPSLNSGGLESTNQTIVKLGDTLATKTSFTLAVISLGYQF